MTAMLALLSACNNGSKPSTELVTAEPEITLGRLICGGHLPLAIAEKMFRDNLKGFHLKIIQYHDWNDVIADLKSGRLDGAFTLSPLAMNMIRGGFAAKIVLMADRNGNSFVLSKSIKSIAGLRHKKTIIAVPYRYSQQRLLLHMALKQHAVRDGHVTVISMPPRDMVKSLRRGEIDGFVVGAPEGNRSVSVGIGWLAAISPQIWRNHMDHVFLASNRLIKGQSKHLQELVNTLVASGKFIRTHPHEAAVMGEDYTGAPGSVFEQVLTDPRDWISYNDMLPSKDDVVAMASQMVDMGLWKKIPKDAEHFIDASFVQKAYHHTGR